MNFLDITNQFKEPNPSWSIPITAMLPLPVGSVFGRIQLGDAEYTLYVHQ